MKRSRIFLGLSLLALVLLPVRLFAESSNAVLIISIDGLRPDVLLRSDAPSIRKLMQEGSFTVFARTTDLAVTLPSHVSMVTGVPPSTHGVTWNGEEYDDAPRYPEVSTLFELVKASGRGTALVAGKSKFISLSKPSALSWSFIPKGRKSSDEEVAQHAEKVIGEHHPDLIFVHLPDVDGVGHRSGWGSPAQLKAVSAADEAVGRVIKSFEAGLGARRGYIMLSSDHGGIGKGHGEHSWESAFVPLILNGPGIRPNFDLTLTQEPIRIEDIFSTALAILNVPAPSDREGKDLRKFCAEPVD